MRPITLKIPAGNFVETITGFNGDYIRLESAAAPIRFVEPDKRQEVTLEAGEDASLLPFSKLNITHDEPTTQTIVLLVGKGTKKSSSQVAGDMQIIGGAANTANPPKIALIDEIAHVTLIDALAAVGTVDAVTEIAHVTNIDLLDSVTQVDTVAAVTGITNALKKENAGLSSYDRRGAGNTLHTIVTPAANLNGLRIMNACVIAFANYIRIMTKTSAPISVSDTAAATVIAVDSTGASQQIITLSEPVMIPAGYGLYEQVENVTDAQYAFINYELL